MKEIKNSGFTEISSNELQKTDGGLVLFGLTLTLGAKIALACFGGGVVLGVGWALCD